MEGGSVDAGPIQEQIAKERALIEALKSQQSEIATRLADVGGGASIPVVPRPLPPVIPGAGGGGGPAADGFFDAQRAAEERIAALYRERDALGLSADAAARLTTEYEANKLKAELLKEARENGNGVSAFEAQLVTETVDAYREASFALLDATAAHEALAKSQEEAAQASERAREDMKQFTSSMFGAIDASKSLKENLANVGVQLLNLAAQGAGGSGPLAGIFSAIGQGISGFGFSGAGTHGPVTNAPLLAPTFRLPGLASGTNFAQGGATIVGEQGPEIVNMPRGAQVFNAGESAQMLGGRSTNVFNIDARGSNDPAAVEAAAQRGAAMALAQVPGINRDMKRRGAL